MKPLLVGQAPARSGDGRPFTGTSGKRLCELLGVESYDDLVHLLDMTNLIPETQPKIKGAKGDSFDRALARRAAIRLRTQIMAEDREVVILAGVGVAVAFGIKNPRAYKVYGDFGRAHYFVIPHPSGINHYWNVAEHRQRASQFLRAIVLGDSMDHPSPSN